MTNKRKDIACPMAFPVSDGVQKPCTHVREAATDCGDAMKWLVKPIGTNDLFTLPLPPNDGIGAGLTFVYNFNVDWGDGSNDDITSYNQAEITHTYAVGGDYIVTISGTCPSLDFRDYEQNSSRDLLWEIQCWGDTQFEYLDHAFETCSNLTLTALDSPSFLLMAGDPSGSGYGRVNAMFSQCNSIVNGVEHWDITGLTYTQSMFWNCNFLNCDFTAWNFSSIVSTAAMFSGCDDLDGDFTGCNMSSAADMQEMFRNCESFTGKGLSGWNVSNVITFDAMFYGCVIFNQDLSSWDVSSATIFTEMFRECTILDTDLSGWVMTQSINLDSMFRQAAAINFSVASWGVENVTTVEAFLFDALSYTTANYDALLISWAAQTVHPNQTLYAYPSYTVATAQASRDILTGSPNFWLIFDGGAGSPPPPPGNLGEMMTFNGTNSYYNIVPTITGNQLTCMFTLNIPSLSNGDNRQSIMMTRELGGDIRLWFAIYSGNHSVTELQNRMVVIVENTSGVTICRLMTDVDISDGTDKYCFFSFDADAGTAMYYINSVDADDATYSSRIAPTTGTLPNSDWATVIGDMVNLTDPVAGQIGYFGYGSTYLTNPTDFYDLVDGLQAIDEVTWVEWGFVQPEFWNLTGTMNDNRGSEGNMTDQNSNITGPA